MIMCMQRPTPTPPPIHYDPNWRMAPGAEKVPCIKRPSMWEKESGRELNSLARETCATVCPFRVSCYMTSYMSGDSGVIRGGIMLAGRIRTALCARCGVPAVRLSKRRDRKLCAVCVCLWDCYGCGRKFWLDRTTEPKTWRQYHSEECRVESLIRRFHAYRQTRLELAA